jgi:uncharacterized membrane protein YsdA (DUF1294 family)
MEGGTGVLGAPVILFHFKLLTDRLTPHDRYRSVERGKPFSARQLDDVQHIERVSPLGVSTAWCSTRREGSPFLARQTDVSWWFRPPGHVLSVFSDVYGWFRPPEHVLFVFSDVSGWFRPPEHVLFVFSDVFGWCRPPEHVLFVFSDVFGWCRPPRHVHFFIVDASGWFRPPGHVHFVFPDKPPRHIHFLFVDVSASGKALFSLECLGRT